MLNFKIIAVDFDGTLCENKWPEIGEPNLELIRQLKRERAAGAKLILWSCRVDDKLLAAVNWCGKQGLWFDAINENLPEVIEEFGSDTRKIFAHEYIDDKMCRRFELPYIKEGVGITDNVIKKLEQVFGFTLYAWQKQYLKGDDTAMPCGGRGNGKTFAHCVRLLLEDPCNRPAFDLSSLSEINNLVDANHGYPYKRFVIGCLRDINQQLIEAGFRTNAKKQVSYPLNDEDLKVLENFITKDDSVMEFKEMQAVVKMQYDLYRRMMTPSYILKV